MKFEFLIFHILLCVWWACGSEIACNDFAAARAFLADSFKNRGLREILSEFVDVICVACRAWKTFNVYSSVRFY